MQAVRRKTLLLAGIGAAAAIGGGLAGALFVQSGSGAARLLGTPFPDLRGGTRRLVEWQGQVLVCNFWATWCAPCREEIPVLIAAKQQFSARGLEVVGIGIDSADKIRDFAANFSINYPIFIAGTEAIEIMRELGNTAGALPFTVLLDRAGRVAQRRLGAYKEDELRQALLPLLG